MLKGILLTSVMLDKYNRLDILINNAGLFSDSRQQTEEGYELTMGVNYLGTYLFPILFMERMYS